MKRQRTAMRSGRSVDMPEGEQGFWPSFADMMSSFALILFFLMLISYLQNLITGNRLVSTEDLLKETELTLSDTQLALSATELEVEDAKQLLSGLHVELDDARQAILDQQDEMARYAATIAGQTAQIEQQYAQLSEQEATISAQQDYIAITTEELTKLRGQMESVAFMRFSVLEKIRDSIAASLGDTSKVYISDNGSIVLSEGVLFDTNSSVIKSGGYGLLNSLTDSFLDFLSNPDNIKYVDSIVIAGHTDSTGSAEKNRTLSTERANSVLNYLLTKNDKKLSPYSQYFCASGYGATRPIADNSTADGRSQNRRIEISIILKDESVMEIIDTYLESDLPNRAHTPTNAGSRTN